VQLNRLGSLYVTSPAFVTHTQARADALFGAIATGIVKMEVGRAYPLADARTRICKAAAPAA
jgi:NADPH2:quinone reductase